MSEASDKKDFLKIARQRFKLAIDASSHNRTVQIDDVKFAAGNPDNGWQWPDHIRNARLSDPNGPRPCLTINKLPQHIRLVTNEQRQNRPAGKVLPVDDKGDPEVAEILNGIVRHIEVRSHADVAYDTACENQVTHGEGYWRILTEYCEEESFDLDIVIESIRNSFSVYLDPVGLIEDSTGRKCLWGFITDKVHKDEFKRQFPKAKPIDWEQLGTGDEFTTWRDGDYVVIAEYFCIKEETKTIYLWADGSVTDVLIEGIELVKQRTTQSKKVQWSKINAQEVLEEREWAGKYIPIIRVAGNEYFVDGKIHVSGIVRNAKDAQRMGNYYESMDTEMVALAPKAPYVGAVGQFETMSNEWGKANQTAFSRLEYDPVEVNGIALPAPQRQMPPMASTAIMQAKLQSWDNLQSTVGQYNPSLGAEAKEKSGVAIKARQRQADVGTFHYLDNLAASVTYSTEIVVDLIPKIYDTKRVARIVGLDGEPDHAMIDPEQESAVVEVRDQTGAIQKIYNPSIGRYDVTVTVGPGYTTKRQEAAEFMAQVLQGNKELMAIMGDLYFKMLDVPGADEIAERIKRSLPPQLVKDDDEDPSNPEAQRAQLEQAAQMLGQKEAELNAAMEQLEAEKQAISEQGGKAGEAMARVEAKVAELNSQMDALEAEKRELALTQKLAESQLSAKQKEIIFSVERMLADHQKAVEGACESVGHGMNGEGQEGKEMPQMPPEMMQAIVESTQQTADAVRQMLAAMTPVQ